jgi:hypothetical protein
MSPHQDWRWLKEVPKIPMLQESRRRVRFLRREEADRLIDALPTHMKPVVEFALATGCRAGEILGSIGAAWISPEKWPGSITVPPRVCRTDNPNPTAAVTFPASRPR